jgi:hypothetical protein
MELCSSPRTEPKTDSKSLKGSVNAAWFHPKSKKGSSVKDAWGSVLE